MSEINEIEEKENQNYDQNDPLAEDTKEDPSQNEPMGEQQQRRRKNINYPCYGCGQQTTEKGKLVRCNLCMRDFCLECYQKDTYTTESLKKKVMASFICINCIDSDQKERKRPVFLQEYSHLDDLDYYPSRVRERTQARNPEKKNASNGRADRPNSEMAQSRKKEKSVDENILIDMDLIHDNFTPPSEIMETGLKNNENRRRNNGNGRNAPEGENKLIGMKRKRRINHNQYTKRNELLRAMNEDSSQKVQVTSQQRASRPKPSQQQMVKKEKKRDYQSRNMSSTNEEVLCHHCKKMNSLCNTLNCLKSSCNKSYCINCINKNYRNVIFNECYFCKNSCKCESCLNPEKVVEKEPQNIVKVDEFLVYENNEEESQEYVLEENIQEEESESSECENTFKESNFTEEKKPPKVVKPKKRTNDPKVKKLTDDEMISHTVERVEACIDSRRNCQFCSSPDATLQLNFRSFNDVILYIKYFLSTKTKEELEGKYKDSNEQFREYYENYFRKYYLGNSNQSLYKQSKIFCRKCLEDKMTTNSGFYSIYNSMQLNQNLMVRQNEQSQDKENDQKTDKLERKSSNKEGKDSEKVESKFNSNIKQTNRLQGIYNNKNPINQNIRESMMNNNSFVNSINQNKGVKGLNVPPNLLSHVNKIIKNNGNMIKNNKNIGTNVLYNRTLPNSNQSSNNMMGQNNINTNALLNLINNNSNLSNLIQQIKVLSNNNNMTGNPMGNPGNSFMQSGMLGNMNILGNLQGNSSLGLGQFGGNMNIPNLQNLQNLNMQGNSNPMPQQNFANLNNYINTLNLLKNINPAQSANIASLTNLMQGIKQEPQGNNQENPLSKDPNQIPSSNNETKEMDNRQNVYNQEAKKIVNPLPNQSNINSMPFINKPPDQNSPFNYQNLLGLMSGMGGNNQNKSNFMSNLSNMMQQVNPNTQGNLNNLANMNNMNPMSNLNNLNMNKNKNQGNYMNLIQNLNSYIVNKNAPSTATPNQNPLINSTARPFIQNNPPEGEEAPKTKSNEEILMSNLQGNSMEPKPPTTSLSQNDPKEIDKIKNDLSNFTNNMMGINSSINNRIQDLFSQLNTSIKNNTKQQEPKNEPKEPHDGRNHNKAKDSARQDIENDRNIIHLTGMNNVEEAEENKKEKESNKNANDFSSIEPSVLDMNSSQPPNNNNNNQINADYMNIYSILEDLKKQFFSIQYFSLLQKLFISYIFKNIEIFIDQLNKNQLLSDIICTNLLTLVQNQDDSKIAEQVNYLKKVDFMGSNLTSALNTNINSLKTNGIKIFRSLELNLQNNLSSNVRNIMENFNLWDNVSNTNINTSIENLKFLNNILKQGNLQQNQNENISQHMINAINGIKVSNNSTLNVLNNVTSIDNINEILPGICRNIQTNGEQQNSANNNPGVNNANRPNVPETKIASNNQNQRLVTLDDNPLRGNPAPVIEDNLPNESKPKQLDDNIPQNPGINVIRDNPSVKETSNQMDIDEENMKDPELKDNINQANVEDPNESQPQLIPEDNPCAKDNENIKAVPSQEPKEENEEIKEDQIDDILIQNENESEIEDLVP